MSSPKSIAPLRHRFRRCLPVVSGALSIIALAPAGSGQVAAVVDSIASYRPEERPPINSEGVSCNQLKDDLRKAGALSIVSEPRRWPETFYGPEVPQCDPWSRPTFSYVKTSDGACGVGYMCAPRITGGR